MVHLPMHQTCADMYMSLGILACLAHRSILYCNHKWQSWFCKGLIWPSKADLRVSKACPHSVQIFCTTNTNAEFACSVCAHEIVQSGLHTQHCKIQTQLKSAVWVWYEVRNKSQAALEQGAVQWETLRGFNLAIWRFFLRITKFKITNNLLCVIGVYTYRVIYVKMNDETVITSYFTLNSSLPC